MSTAFYVLSSPEHERDGKYKIGYHIGTYHTLESYFPNLKIYYFIPTERASQIEYQIKRHIKNNEGWVITSLTELNKLISYYLDSLKIVKPKPYFKSKLESCLKSMPSIISFFFALNNGIFFINMCRVKELNDNYLIDYLDIHSIYTRYCDIFNFDHLGYIIVKYLLPIKILYTKNLNICNKPIEKKFLIIPKKWVTEPILSFDQYNEV